MLAVITLLAYAASLIAVLLQSTHILSVLVLMEYMVIMLFCSLLHPITVAYPVIIVVSLFVVTVTSAALGLSLLAALSRLLGPTTVLSSSVVW